MNCWGVGVETVKKITGNEALVEEAVFFFF